jgi:hypothetical protein
MKIADIISEEQKSQLDTMSKSPKKPQKNADNRDRNKDTKNQDKKPKPMKKEKIDWHDLMGSKNRGMKRGKGGAYRNR